MVILLNTILYHRPEKQEKQFHFLCGEFHIYFQLLADMEKVKKFPLSEFLGFIISAKKCAILDMSKSAKITVYFQN